MCYALRDKQQGRSRHVDPADPSTPRPTRIQSITGTVTRPMSGEATRIASTDLLANGGLVLVALLMAAVPSMDSMTAFVPLFALLGTARGGVIVSNTISMVDEVGGDAERRRVASGLLNSGREARTS